MADGEVVCSDCQMSLQGTTDPAWGGGLRGHRISYKPGISRLTPLAKLSSANQTDPVPPWPWMTCYSVIGDEPGGDDSVGGIWLGHNEGWVGP